MAEIHLRLNWSSHVHKGGSAEHVAYSTPYMIKHGMALLIRQQARAWLWEVGIRGQSKCGSEATVSMAQASGIGELIRQGHPNLVCCPYDMAGKRICNLCFREGGCSLVGK